MPSPEEIVERFTYHAPNERQRAMFQAVHERILDLALWVGAELEPSRDQSIALTALEDVRMKINKAIVFDRRAQQE